MSYTVEVSQLASDMRQQLVGYFSTFSLSKSLLLVLLSFASRTVYRLFMHPLAKIPGPWYFAISRIPVRYCVNISGKWFSINRGLHEKYGPIVRVGPNQISVRGEIGWKSVYAHKARDSEEWSKWPQFFNVPPDIVTAPTADHRRMRKEIIRAFSDKAIQEQHSTVSHYAQLFIQRLKERDQTVVDISKWLNFFTFDTFGDLAFGESFGSLEGGESHPWISLIFDTIKLNKQASILNEFPLLRWIAEAITPQALKHRARYHFELSVEKIQKRLAKGADGRKDFISYIWKADGSGQLSRDEMERNASTLIVAGSETTATTLSGLIYYLLANPEKYHRLAEEVRSAFGGNEEEITFQTSSSLPYVQACVEEALRCFPAVAIGAPRQVPFSGGFVEGHWLPGKTLVEVPQWATHRAEANFYHPDEFIPERWLPIDHPLYDQKCADDNKSVVQPFSHGPRACLGRTLAYYEMRYIICRLFMDFDFELAPGAENWIGRCGHYFFWDKPPLPVKLVACKQFVAS